MSSCTKDAHLHEVEKLAQQIRGCRICVEQPLKDALPHQPRPVIQLSSEARICIAGQAPGLRVHESGIPFDDRSGDRLRSWLGVDRQKFYDNANFAIVPMGFCFPGYDAKKSDLPPRKECRLNWHDQVYKFLPQLELILVIGQYAQAYHLGEAREKTMTETVRNWRRYFHTNHGVRYLALPHPSWRNTGWLKRNSWFEQEVLPALQEEVSKLTSL